MKMDAKELVENGTALADVYLKIQANLSLLRMTHLYDAVPEAEAKAVQDEIVESLGIEFSIPQVTKLLDAHPDTKAQVLVYGIDDTETASKVIDMITNFILGCNFPRYGDDVPEDAFMKILRTQALSLGYKTIVV